MLSVSAKPFWKPCLLTTLLIALGFILGCGKKEPTQQEVLAGANARASAGDHAAAATTLENYLATHPGAFEVVEALAFTYAEANDPAMSAFYFRRAAEIDPSQPEYLLYAARALEQSGDSAGAADSYRKYLTARPGDAGVYRQLAEINLVQGNRSAAIDAYLQANRHEPGGDTQNAIARLYLQGGNQAQAQTWFASAAQGDPVAREAALLGLLEISLRAERYADAEELVLTIDREFPGAIEASPLGQARQQLAAWREAQDDAAAALAAITDVSSSPVSPSLTTPAGQDEDNETPSSETVSTAPAPGPSPAASEPITEQGPTGQPPPPDKDQLVAEVEAEFDQPMELFPDSGQTTGSGGAASASSRTGEYQGLVQQARNLAAVGDHENAIRNFQRALARENSDPEVWRELSESQFQAGQYSRAPASASEAVRRAPDDPGFLLQYLRVAQRTLPQERIVRELEAARSRFPRSGAVALALARAYESQGSRGYAGRMYREFLRLAPPDHPDRAEIEQLFNN